MANLNQLQEDAGRPKTVLLVDDSAIVRKFLRQIFQSEGFEVCGEAANGAEAIDLAMKFKPDLIIMDLSMPQMNGIQAAPVLRRILPNTPIVLFSMFADNVLANDALRAGFSAVVPKSDINTLIAVAQAQLGPVRFRR